MNHFKKLLLGCTMMASIVVGSGIATASPTDSYFPWSYGGLRVATVAQGSDNQVTVRFRNSDGSIRKYWPNSAGVDICRGTDILVLARARENFKEIVDGLHLAGLYGRSIWVAYEPIGSVCYIKSIDITMQ